MIQLTNGHQTFSIYYTVRLSVGLSHQGTSLWSSHSDRLSEEPVEEDAGSQSSHASERNADNFVYILNSEEDLEQIPTNPWLPPPHSWSTLLSIGHRPNYSLFLNPAQYTGHRPNSCSLCLSTKHSHSSSRRTCGMTYY